MPLAFSVLTVGQWFVTGAAVCLLLVTVKAAFVGELPRGLPAMLLPRETPDGTSPRVAKTPAEATSVTSPSSGDEAVPEPR